MEPFRLPRLYAILDGSTLRASEIDLFVAARQLRDAGISLVQYREKTASVPEILENARMLRTIFDGSGAILLLNDWPEIAVKAELDGVHIGQTDAHVAAARQSIGPNCLIGVSTHTPEQFQAALATDANYIAYGPIFSTQTKPDAESAVGIEGLKEVRKLSDRHLVAIGGISRERLGEVLNAGADSVALVGALYERGRSIAENASRLLQAVET